MQNRNQVVIAPMFRAAVPALDEVNQTRAARGLPPFEEVPCLTLAAQRCATYRAAHHIQGHTPNDFLYLDPGCRCDATGCAAWEPSWGWGSCCQFERWKYAGAAYAIGDDGLRYMHLFCSNDG